MSQNSRSTGKDGNIPLATELQRDISTLLIELNSGGRDAWLIQGRLPAESLLELSNEATVDGAGAVKLSIGKQDNLWQVKGALTISVILPCSRCLADYVRPLDIAVNRFISIGEDPALSLGQTEMEEDIVYLESGEFSVLRFAEEEFILALPMFPLCNEACLGLCQNCGADKNQEPCTCPSGEKVNPFTVLEQIKLN
ncbi:MAG: DUF177 domain-containing protein [Magnetococcales bacterium]|nr:DUF177 domain-containing protein [Magnetococcales bacterium]